MFEAHPPAKPIEIFISYSHDDENYRHKLETFLVPLRMNGLISDWHDRQIIAGTDFAGVIDQHLNSASVILLLVSANFIASDYCYGIEMRRALERYEKGEACVIPIILSSCLWDETPLAKLEALPTGARPINTWRDRDRAFTIVGDGIRTVIRSLIDAGQTRNVEETSAAPLTPYTGFNNLPMSLPPFVGRQKELDELKRYLRRDPRILVLHGSGGTGKTRLALQVASDLIKDYEHGACYVPLEKVSDPDLLPSAIAAALKLKEVEESVVKDSLKGFLENKQMLLLLDTFEHIASPANIKYLADLCSSCPRLKILLTSRVRIRIREAQYFRVPMLALPREEDYLPPERLSQFDAVILFIQRAREIDPEFEITNDNAPAVAQICVKLEGLALAIELVAASINLFNRNPREILPALENMLAAFDSMTSESSERRTMRASITWSYELLTPREQTLLKRLSVFKNGFAITAVEAVCNATNDLNFQISEGLWSLVDNNLLRPDEAVTSGNRFKMSEVISEYGQELLEESKEITAIKRRHAEYFLTVAEEAEVKITSKERNGWLERLEIEHGNLRAALSWCRGRKGDCELGLRLAGALFWFWNLQAHFSEGRGWLNDLLKRTKSSPVRAARAKALYGAGGLAFLQGDDVEARSFIDSSVKMWRELDDKRGLAFALIIQGMVSLNLGDAAKAFDCEKEAVDIFAELKDDWGLALAYNDWGNVYRHNRQYPEALKRYKKSLKIWKDLDDTWGQPLTLSNLGFLDFLKGSFGSARRQLEVALNIQRDIKDKWGISETVKYLGDLAVRRGDYSTAENLYRESLIWNRELGRKKLIIACLAGLAVVAAKTKQTGRALWLFKATDSLSKDFGTFPKFFDYGMYDPTKAALLSQARTAKLKAEQAKSSKVGLEQAIAYAFIPANN